MATINQTWDREGNELRRETIDLDAGTYTLEVDGVEVESRALTPEEVIQYSPPPPTPEELEAQALRVSARLTITDKVRAEELTDEEVASIAAIFEPWDGNGVAYEAGDVRRWDGTLIEAITGHTSEPQFTPDLIPNLWKIHRAAGSVAPWVQPQGSHDAYTMGERVTHNGQTWESTVDANVWEPGVFGWAVV